MVAGDHGAGDLGLWSIFRPPSGRRFLVVSRAFSLLFSPVFFFDISPYLLGLIPLKETHQEVMQIRAQKLPIFGKAEDSIADFPPRVETRSNDVRMT